MLLRIVAAFDHDRNQMTELGEGVSSVVNMRLRLVGMVSNRRKVEVDEI